MQAIVVAGALWAGLAGVALAAPSAADLAKLAGLTEAEAGQIVNACAEAVTPTLAAVDLGGAAGTAQLLVIPGGPNQLTCYGDTPGDMYLFVVEGSAWRQVFNGAGFLMVLPGTHQDVHDFALGGPGFTFPVFAWDGQGFARATEITDAELSALGAVPTFP